MSKVLVVGATGATGKHVVQILLDKGQNVHVIARSKEKMLGLLKEQDYGDRLTITEGSLLDLKDEEISEKTKDCQAIVSCLGHNMTVSGLWGHPRKLVTDAATRLTTAMPKNKGCKFILMGSDGVSHPDNTTDKRRGLMERSMLFLLRYLIPPHADNEGAALFLYENRELFEWSVVRPTDFIDADEVSEYDIFEQQQGSLFGSGVATRANVADFMVKLIMEEETWGKYKHKMPILYDKKKTDAKS
jgi:nucleoside-diphosphate-sugar epimerase